MASGSSGEGRSRSNGSSSSSRTMSSGSNGSSKSRGGDSGDRVAAVAVSIRGMQRLVCGCDALAPRVDVDVCVCAWCWCVCARWQLVFLTSFALPFLILPRRISCTHCWGIGWESTGCFTLLAGALLSFVVSTPLGSTLVQLPPHSLPPLTPHTRTPFTHTWPCGADYGPADGRRDVNAPLV